MTDRQLEHRAGLNVGNQPGFLTFIQKAGSRSVEIPLNGTKAVLVEGVESGFRTLQNLEESSVLANTTPASYDWSIFFEDDEGNQMAVGSGTVAAGAMGGIRAVDLTESMFTLAPGEKFLLSVTLTPPPEA